MRLGVGEQIASSIELKTDRIKCFKMIYIMVSM